MHNVPPTVEYFERPAAAEAFNRFTSGVHLKRFSAASAAPCAGRTDIRWRCSRTDFRVPTVPGRIGTCSDLRPGRCTRPCAGRRPARGGWTPAGRRMRDLGWLHWTVSGNRLRMSADLWRNHGLVLLLVGESCSNDHCCYQTRGCYRWIHGCYFHCKTVLCEAGWSFWISEATGRSLVHRSSDVSYLTLLADSSRMINGE